MSQPYAFPPPAQRPTARAHFYRELPSLLAPAFPGIKPEALQLLTTSAHCYFKFALVLDDVLDGDLTLTAQTRPVVLKALTLHERALKGLAWLFPEDASFWKEFERCRQSFDDSQQADTSHQAATDCTEERFEELAVAKSAMSEVVAFALHGLSAHEPNLSAVLQCLRWYHTASQYEDDIIDFCEDWKQGHYTYTHAQVLAYLKRGGVSQQGPLAVESLQQYLYTSGVAGLLLGRAEHYYRRVTTQAQLLGLITLATLATEQTNHTVALRALITEQVGNAFKRAQQQLTETASQASAV
jgi:hypothetical protein